MTALDLLDVLVRGLVLGGLAALLWLATRPWMWDLGRGRPDHIDDADAREERAAREGRQWWEVRRG